MEKLQKNRFGRINITLDFAQSRTKSETITIIYRALSRFTVMPSALFVFYSEPGKPIKKSLWITNNYAEDFEVESTASKDGHIKVLSQKKDGDRYQFSLEITPPPGEGVRRFTDTFTISLKEGKPLEVGCRGIYRAPSSGKTGD
jgi:hypothetical protein